MEASVTLDTPLSRLRPAPYAWLGRELLEEWGDGLQLATLAALASLLRRRGRSLGLTAPELAESTGLCADTTRRHLRAFGDAGLAAVDAAGVWRPTRRLRKRKHGHAARIEARNLALLVARLGGSGLRALCWDRLYTTRSGRLTVSYEALAHRMGCHRTTVWRGIARLRAAGIACGARVSRASRKTATSMRRKLQRILAPTPPPSGKRSGKGDISRISGSGGLSAAECERERRRQRAALAEWARREGLAA